MPNYKHNRKLFESALEKVHNNDETIQNLYSALTEQTNTQNQQQLNEIVGSLLIGLAAAAPAIATGVGMYQKHKKEERARQDELTKIAQDRAERKAAAEAERAHATSERIGRQGFETTQAGEERQFKASQAGEERAFKKGESQAERGFRTSEREAGERFTTSERGEEQKFRRGERLGGQRFTTKTRESDYLAKMAIELAKRGAKVARGKGKGKGKGPKGKGRKGTP